MIRPVALLAFLLSPAALVVVVDAHGCPAFTINDTISRGQYLSMDDKTFPADLKSIISGYDDNSTVFTGVYDCHYEEGENEVGMAAICGPDVGCSCVAMYNFEVCDSCELECVDDDDIADLTIKSYAADCSNVRGGLTDRCEVGCGFLTTGCLASESLGLNITDGGIDPPLPTGGMDGPDGADGTGNPPQPGGMNETDVTTTSTPPPKGGSTGGGSNSTKDDKDDKDDDGEEGVSSPSAVPVDGAGASTPPPKGGGGGSNTTKDDGADDMAANVTGTVSSKSPTAAPEIFALNGTGTVPTFPPMSRAPRSSPPVRAPSSSTVGASNSTSAAASISAVSYYRCAIGAVVSAVGLWW